MAFNRLGKQPKHPNSSRQRLQYEQFEQRRLLAGDIGLSANSSFLLEQLASHEDTAWTQQGLNQLVEVASETNDTGTTSVFQQAWNGLPVHDSFVTVVQDSDGNITNVRDQGTQDLGGYAQDSDPISAQLAARIGSQDLGTAATTDSKTSLAWFLTGDRARLSYLVETSVLDSAGEVTEEFDTWVNIFNGSIFHSEASGASAAEQLTGVISEVEAHPWVVINDATGPDGSRALAEPFDAVIQISVGCTGTLIAPNAVISARHCGIGAGDTINFGDDSNNPDFSIDVASSTNPGGGNAGSDFLDGGDVSLHILVGDVPASVATPMRFVDSTDDLVGEVALWIGYGRNGVGSVGSAGADGFRWAAENVIDAYGEGGLINSGANLFTSDFDDGTAGNSTTGTATPLVLEGMGGPGDSGGPMLVNVNGEWVIGAVVSGGTTRDSVYGTTGWWTGSSVYRAEIEALGGEFLSGGEGSVEISNDRYFVGDAVDFDVIDGNVIGDITVTVTSDSGDIEVLTLSSALAGSYSASIDTSADGVNTGDGILQVASGDQIQVTYTDVDDGSGNTFDRIDTADIVDVAPPALIGIDFDDTTNNPPLNWLGLAAGSLEANDLLNEDGGASRIDLAIDGSPLGFSFPIDADTVPQYSNDLTNVDGQIYTGAETIQFTYSDLNPLQDYYVYVLSADGFYDTIEQSVSIQGDGDAISFEQQFSRDQLFINDQVGDSSRDLIEYALVITADSRGEITIDVDPILDTEDVVVSGLAIFEVPQTAPAAPAIVLNDASVDRSIVNEVVVSFDDIVTLGPNPFELIKRGSDGGAVNVTPTVDNSSGVSVITLTFDAGSLVTDGGSLVDGNYQLTVFGDQVTVGGVAVDGDGDGFAGGNLVFGDTEADNFFRFFGDVDGNRVVNASDLLGFRRTWLSSDSDSGFDERFDSNADGTINVVDLLEFRQNYLNRVDFE